MYRRQFFIILASLLAFFILFSSIFSIIRSSRISSELETLNETMRADKNLLNRVIESENELRLSLGMEPAEWYDNVEETEDLLEETIEENWDHFYKAIDYLADHQDEIKSAKQFTEIIEGENFTSFLEGRGLLSIRKDLLSYKILLDGNELLIISKNDSNNYSVLGFMGDVTDFNSIDSSLENYIIEQKTAYIEMIEFWQTGSANIKVATTIPELAREIDDNWLYTNITESDSGILLEWKPIDHSTTIRTGLNKYDSEFFINDDKFNSWESFKEALIITIQEGDFRTRGNRAEDKSHEMFTQLLVDPGFLTYLEQNGFTINTTPRRDEPADYINYDIYNESGDHVGSLAIIVDIGEIYLLDEDDVPLKSLRTFSESGDLFTAEDFYYRGEVQEINDLFSTSNSESYLLIGSHERNADTIIVVHTDLDSGTTKMISIPRDLWYQGRKVNTYYLLYGPGRLLEIVSDITGLDIEKYIAVDMYAFVEVVNILGGVDIHLDEALIDPTYTIKENGVWSTLYYPAGDVHLDGLGALRVARSRHTSDDFERGSRQQLIIEALKLKVEDSIKNDKGSLMELLSTLNNYVDTNMSLVVIAADFFKYKNNVINTGNGLTSKNVLYSSYVNLYRLSPEEQEEKRSDSDFHKGQWIVLPRNNDWNVIRQYIRNIVE